MRSFNSSRSPLFGVRSTPSPLPPRWTWAHDGITTYVLSFLNLCFLFCHMYVCTLLNMFFYHATKIPKQLYEEYTATVTRITYHDYNKSLTNIHKLIVYYIVVRRPCSIRSRANYYVRLLKYVGPFPVRRVQRAYLLGSNWGQLVSIIG